MECEAAFKEAVFKEALEQFAKAFYLDAKQRREQSSTKPRAGEHVGEVMLSARNRLFDLLDRGHGTHPGYAIVRQIKWAMAFLNTSERIHEATPARWGPIQPTDLRYQDFCAEEARARAAIREWEAIVESLHRALAACSDEGLKLVEKYGGLE